MQCVWSVSYTHLDVYKRQVQVVDGYVLGKNPGIAVVIAYTADGYSVSFPVTVIGKPELSASVTAVSYTHLDVYKRQHY